MSLTSYRAAPPRGGYGVVYVGMIDRDGLEDLAAADSPVP